MSPADIKLTDQGRVSSTLRIATLYDDEGLNPQGFNKYDYLINGFTIRMSRPLKFCVGRLKQFRTGPRAIYY